MSYKVELEVADFAIDERDSIVIAQQNADGFWYGIRIKKETREPVSNTFRMNDQDMDFKNKVFKWLPESKSLIVTKR